MSVREQYEQKAEAMAQPIIDQFGFELVDVEYVKEAGNWYLRFYIDKEGGITVDDCEAVSRIFSDKLDELDFIEDAYIMEVSSPGLGRPLKKEKDYVRSMGKEVEIRTYRPINKEKEFYGILSAYDESSVTITTEDQKEQTFEKADIALIRLAFDFKEDKEKMNTELLEALTILEKEKNISKEVLMEAIEQSLIQACKTILEKQITYM